MRFPLPEQKGTAAPMPRGPALAAMGFLLAIAAGTIALGFPQAVASGHAPLSLDEALFTATSAVCVTGLTVVSTASDLSLWGQGIVFFLIQLGGVGVMTLALLVFESLRGGFSATSGEYLSSNLGHRIWTGNPRKTLNLVLGATLLTEAAGFLLLLPHFHGQEHGAWQALFLTVSAFCNAGFDIIPGGLATLPSKHAVGMPLLGLWVIGGFGFLLPAAWMGMRSGNKASLDPALKLILHSGLWLLILAPVLFLALEGRGDLKQDSWADQLLSALFHGNTTRTAGFSFVDWGQAQRTTLLAFIPFMLIGGAPGGTAGGVKTTTAVIFCKTLIAHARGEQNVLLYDRRLPARVLRRSVLICGMMVALWAFLVLMLALFDPLRQHPLEHLAFEAASALGTVGLTTGVTADQPLGGRLALTLAMLIGRLGPLTAAFFLFRPRQEADPLTYPEADIPVG